jgi:hypothetical protein
VAAGRVMAALVDSICFSTLAATRCVRSPIFVSKVRGVEMARNARHGVGDDSRHETFGVHMSRLQSNPLPLSSITML